VVEEGLLGQGVRPEDDVERPKAAAPPAKRRPTIVSSATVRWCSMPTSATTSVRWKRWSRYSGAVWEAISVETQPAKRSASEQAAAAREESFMALQRSAWESRGR
jgi:hypothetical protein